MTEFEDFEKFLPQYLNPEDKEELFRNLSEWPDNIDGRLYTTRLLGEETVYQGDGLQDLLMVSLPDVTPWPAPCMVLSNTCDTSPSNSRRVPKRACYAPILDLAKFERGLRRENTLEDGIAVSAQIEIIRTQKVTNLFYLPNGQGLDYEAVVLLDTIMNCPPQDLYAGDLRARRLFTLSDYGFYLLLFKLSVHFSRQREEVSRGG